MSNCSKAVMNHILDGNILCIICFWWGMSRTSHHCNGLRHNRMYQYE